MISLAYTLHRPENFELVAQRISERKPSIYLTETPDNLNRLYASFTDDKSMTFEDLKEGASKAGWNRFEVKGFDKIFYAARDAGAQILGAESPSALKGFIKAYDDYRSLASYFGTIYEFVGDFDIMNTGIENFIKYMEATIRKEVKRENGVVKRVRKLDDVPIFGDFGLSHRTLKHLMNKSGIPNEGEILGDCSLDPLYKYHSLLKYEAMGLDPEELRSDDINSDINPAMKTHYFDLIPLWLHVNQKSLFGNHRKERIVYFWEHLDEIREQFESQDPKIIL